MKHREPAPGSALATIVFAALLLAAMIVIGGCGGGSSTAADPTITKAELIKRGDRICEAADNTEFKESVRYERAHIKELEKLSTQKRLEKLLVIVGLPSILKEAHELEALGMPPGDAKELEILYREIKAAAARARQHPSEIDEPAGPFAKPDALAKNYGFHACSELT
jgi:hypothetical protein